MSCGCCCGSKEKKPVEMTPALPWVVVLTASLFFFFGFIQMNVFNSIAKDLMADFHISALKFGVFGSLYLWGNTLMLFPAGMIIDRYSTKWIILINLAISVIATALMGWTHNLDLAEACRFVIGLNCAFCFVSCLRLASRWFPPYRLALVTGLIVTIAMAGGAAAQTPFSDLLSHLGWREAMEVNASLGALIFLIIARFVIDTPPGFCSDKTGDSKAETIDFWESIAMALTNIQNWLGGLYTSLLNIPIMVLGALWGNLFFMTIYHVNEHQASVMSMMIFVGTIIGSPVVGWISDKLLRRKLPMIVGAIISLATMFAIMYAPNPSYSLLVALFLFLGFITSAQVIGYPVISESNPLQITATALGLGSTLIMGGGAAAQDLAGKLLDYHWKTHGALLVKIQGVMKPLYTIGDYQFAMWIIPGSFILGLLCAFLIRETHCKLAK